MKSNVFEVKVDGKKVKLEVVTPGDDILIEAGKIYSKTFSDTLRSGGMLRKKLSDELRKQGLWDDEKQKRLDELQKQIVEKEYRLHKGKMKLSEAKELALSIKKDRAEQTALLTTFNEYDSNTVEGQADNAKFNYLVYACTVYSNTKERYFKSYEEFITYKDPVAFIAASKYAKEYYGLTENFESTLPENKFLKKYKFVDENLRFINSEGKLIDEEGHLIDENGNRIDDQGNRLDIFGYKRTEDGEFADESEPFLDEDGKPIVVDSE
jgi:hypothetical protein